MKSTDKFVLVLVASLALLLAGCGGGSSTPATPPAPSGPSPAEMAIMDAKTALATAQAGVSSASTDAGMLAAYQAVQAAASNLINVLAENGGSAADRSSAIEALNNAAAEIGRLEMAIADAAKANAAAIGKLLAGLDGLTELASGIRATDPDNTNTPPAMAITAAYGKATTVDATDGTTAANSNTKLKGAMGTTMAGANGWSGTMVTATQAAVGTTTTKKTDTVLVYTNIEAPMSVAFSKVYGEGDYTIGANADSNIQAAKFSTGNAPFAHGTNDDTAVNEVIRIQGTYAGASGVYSCTEASGAGCTSQGTNSGIQLGAGTWVFEPSPDAMATQTDSNYSYFGWWLRENADGTYSPSTFHGHETGLTSTRPNIPTALTGKATYSGPAVGKFAIAGLPNSGGHFTADASLSVNFEGTTVAGTAGDVEGTVTNFMAGGAAMPWSVDFNNATSGLEVAGGFNGTATWTIDGTASATSDTNGGFYRGTFQRNDADTDDFPMSATGTWEVPYVAANSTEAIGHMIGAFGVTKDD